MFFRLRQISVRPAGGTAVYLSVNSGVVRTIGMRFGQHEVREMAVWLMSLGVDLPAIRMFEANITDKQQFSLSREESEWKLDAEE